MTDIFISIKNPVRLGILEQLEVNGAQSFKLLQHIVSDSGKLSFHLRILRESKLISHPVKLHDYTITARGQESLQYILRMNAYDEGIGVLDDGGKVRSKEFDDPTFLAFMHHFHSWFIERYSK